MMTVRYRQVSLQMLESYFIGLIGETMRTRSKKVKQIFFILTFIKPMIQFISRFFLFCNCRRIAQNIKLKLQSCKLCDNKYMIASTEIANTEIFAFKLF